MALTIDEAIARVPQWQGRDDIRATVLAGGITNQNYRVEVGPDTYVLRISGANTELLGVNRDVEYEASRAASSIGIGPEVFHLITPEQYLITRFVEGQPISVEEIGQPENILLIIHALRKIHALTPVSCAFNAFRFVENAARIANEYGVAFPDNFDWMIARTHEIENALAAHQSAPCLCHNDLLNANFLIDSADKLYLLDWEYAGMGDPYFDLANFTANHEFTGKQERAVLDAYFGEVTPQNLAHLKLIQIMSDFREAMWGMVQIGISTLDFDFRDYADKHFARLTSRMNDANYPRWLEEASNKF
jgi:thiamine kinase-like enzyme